MPEKSGHVYDGYELTDVMVCTTRTVFLRHAESKECFAVLGRTCREHISEWDAWVFDKSTGRLAITACGHTYESCLMQLASHVRCTANFEVLYSDERAPNYR